MGSVEERMSLQEARGVFEGDRLAQTHRRGTTSQSVLSVGSTSDGPGHSQLRRCLVGTSDNTCPC
jgi:hypothetical protein